MKEFVALVKANPDKFNVSTPPIGTTPQLQAEVLKLREGLQKMATVVFKGGGDARQGGARRHRAAELRHARARASADPGRHAAGAGADRREALRRAARRSDHGRAGLQGFRVRHLLRADGAGQGARTRSSPGWKRSAWTSWPRTTSGKSWSTAGFDVTAKDGKGHAARIAKEIPMFKKIIEDAGIAKL